MKHPIEEPHQPNDVSHSEHNKIMTKVFLLFSLTCFIIFVVGIHDYLTYKFNLEDRQLLTEPSKHNLLCIVGNKLVTITEPIMLITDTSYVTEYKSFTKTNCKVVAND